MRAFVTGANGFVGSNLVRRLVADGHEVRGMARSTSDLSFLEGVEVALVRGDITDATAIAQGVRGTEVVFHVAGLAADWGPRSGFYRTNVTGTSRVLDAARAAGVARVVYISSATVHGFSGYRLRTEGDATPPSPFPYVESKQRAEEVVNAAEGIETVILRPGNIFGPRDRVTSLPLLKALAAGFLPVIDEGRALTCPTYVENLVDAMILASRVPRAAGRTYLITDGLEITWAQYLDALAGAACLRRPRISLPGGPTRRLASGVESIYRALGIKAPPPLTTYRVNNAGIDYHFTPRRAMTELGWEPRIPLGDACLRTAEWFRSVCPDTPRFPGES